MQIYRYIYLYICIHTHIYVYMYIADNWSNVNWWYQVECREWNCKENKGRAKERKIIEGDL